MGAEDRNHRFADLNRSGLFFTHTAAHDLLALDTDAKFCHSPLPSIPLATRGGLVLL